MSVDPVQSGLLFGLLILFVFCETIAEWLGSALDTLPMRLAFCILLLAIVPVDRLVALGMFMVIGAIYIRHHKDDLDNIIVIKNPMASNYTKAPKAMTELDQGGQADESYDEMDFTSKDDDQTNEFHKVSSSIDEKHALQTEGLGSKSQSLFPEDSHKAAELMKGNSDGSQD